jgi:hypothetical protein
VSVNPITGEVVDEETFPGTQTALVPLNLAGMSEDEILAMFPTPVQAAGALLYARDVARRAPAALDHYRTALKKAEKELRIAVALAAEQLLSMYPRMPMAERRDLARAVDDRTIAAQDAVDDAYLQLEYARDFDRMIGRDIDILRSLNANMRGEHR